MNKSHSTQFKRTLTFPLWLAQSPADSTMRTSGQIHGKQAQKSSPTPLTIKQKLENEQTLTKLLDLNFSQSDMHSVISRHNVTGLNIPPHSDWIKYFSLCHACSVVTTEESKICSTAANSPLRSIDWGIFH